MSDYTDEMLDGDFCEECGVYMGDGNGFPVKCSCCEDEVNNE